MALVSLSALTAACSNNPQEKTIQDTISQAYMNGVTAFKMTSIKTSHREEKTVNDEDSKLNWVAYQVDATVEAQNDCYTKNPNQKTVTQIPMCVTTQELAEAEATAQKAQENPGSVDMGRAIASVMLVKESKSLDMNHPVKAGTQFTLTKVGVACNNVSTEPKDQWHCKAVQVK